LVLKRVACPGSRAAGQPHLRPGGNHQHVVRIRVPAETQPPSGTPVSSTHVRSASAGSPAASAAMVSADRLQLAAYRGPARLRWWAPGSVRSCPRRRHWQSRRRSRPGRTCRSPCVCGHRSLSTQACRPAGETSSPDPSDSRSGVPPRPTVQADVPVTLRAQRWGSASPVSVRAAGSR
jgi:hypothetical protein